MLKNLAYIVVILVGLGGCLLIGTCVFVGANVADELATGEGAATIAATEASSRDKWLKEHVPTMNVDDPRAIVKEYENNEVKADQANKGRWNRVLGYVTKIGKDIFNKPYVCVGSDDDLRQCQFMYDERFAEAELADLNIGDKVDIVGKCSGLMMNVLYENSRLIKYIE